MNLLQTTIRKQQSDISFFDKIGYGSGNFSTGVIQQVVGTYLVFYCTVILGIPGGFIGTAMSLSIVWDAVTDPFMGYISDSTRSKRFGRRHQYLLIGGMGMAVANLFLWNLDPDMSTGMKFGMILLLILSIKTFSTIYVTPYSALGAELSKDYHERTEIQSVKTVFFLLGLAFVSVFGMYVFFQPTSLFPSGQLNPQSYRLMGIFSSLVVVGFSLFTVLTTKKYIPVLKEHMLSEKKGFQPRQMLEEFRRIFINREFRAVSLSYMFNNIASALLANMGLHVFTFTFFFSSQQIAIIVGVQFAVSILAQPLWYKISLHLDKKPSMKIGILISLVSCVMFSVMVLFRQQVQGIVWYFIPFAALAGFGTSGLFTLPQSMMADVVDKDELQSGERAEGSYYGFLTMFYKLSQSITLLLIGWFLDFVKFDASNAMQGNTTAISMGLFIGIGSIVGFMASYVAISMYGLNKDRIERIQTDIELQAEEE
ncbi:MFS transporter [Alkalibacter rhizosphaerae]|uniref:MFS transporter n=1 Tax=Alkalibacter rhizosphaerae TaxID=2815577 RepID=A0A974XFE0_9FIRM|nr:MFS transporter [Alkalibacter rhizosphaerae]QSX08849.1 MFS transporter [Alkalibacter rhizosphaerae]